MQQMFDRKRRTRQHVIADLSVNFLERVILEEGHTTHRIVSDYGYDLAVMTFDEKGYAEPGLIFFQLKATDSLSSKDKNYWYDIDIKHYNLWMHENLPVILVLFDAIKRRAYWVHVQDFFKDPTGRPTKASKTVRIRIPRRQVLNGRSVRTIRSIKQPKTFRIAEETTDA
jgi:hypothetical protein